MNKKIKEWKKAFQGKNIYTVKIDDEDVQVVEVADALIEIDQALKAQREEIGQEYKKWALTHTPTWETDNLVHDLMGNPDNSPTLWNGKDLREELIETLREYLKSRNDDDVDYFDDRDGYWVFDGQIDPKELLDLLSHKKLIKHLKAEYERGKRENKGGGRK